MGGEIAFVVAALEGEELFGLGGSFVEGLGVGVGDEFVCFGVDVENGGSEFVKFVEGVEFVFDEESYGEDGELLPGHVGDGGEGGFEDDGGGGDVCREFCGDASAEGASE